MHDASTLLPHPRHDCRKDTVISDASQAEFLVVRIHLKCAHRHTILNGIVKSIAGLSQPPVVENRRLHSLTWFCDISHAVRQNSTSPHLFSAHQTAKVTTTPMLDSAGNGRSKSNTRTPAGSKKAIPTNNGRYSNVCL